MGGGERAVPIGNDLTKIDFLLKNVDLGQFRPFLDLLDLKNGSARNFGSENGRNMFEFIK